MVARLLPPTSKQWCVDIAASDGASMSNTLALFRAGWSGLSVELDGHKFARLAALHAAFTESRLIRTRVTPDNVLAMLAAADVPVDFGFLSLDTDSYDYFVLDQLLTGYRPTLIRTETNEKIHPPLKFTVLYDQTYSWDGSHFYGQSISQLDELSRMHNYSIVELEYNSAFLMPQELVPAACQHRTPTGLATKSAQTGW